MKVSLFDISMILLVAIILLALDRYYRIEGFINPNQCGVGLPSCPNGTKCINGYCKSTDVPKLKPTMLPVFP
jgi:hypothetical protein